jgi:endoglucanase
MKRSLTKIQFFLVFCFLFIVNCGNASDVVDVFALNSHIIVLHFDDGYVEYHKRGESRQKDRVVHQPLDVSESLKPENYLILSKEGFYSEAKNPSKIERKSKGTEFTWLCQGWSHSTGCINSAPDHAKEHWLYLHLPEPLEMGKIYTISTGQVAGNGSDWELNFSLEKNRTEAIHVNLVGYDPRAPQKYGYVYHWAGNGGGVDFSAYAGNTFFLVDLYSHEKVFSGILNFRKNKNNIESRQPNDTPHQNFLGADVYECDFSAFNASGEYYLTVEGIGRSFSFKIERDIYRHPFYNSVRGLYHNRSGINLEEPYTEFTRPAPHNPLETPGFEGKLFYTSSRQFDWNDLNHSASDLPAIEAGIKGSIDTWGWYQDAGDWDGYFWHMKIPVLLMLTWEIAPEKFADGELNLPEGTNQIPDILDEARWLIRFLHRTRHEIMNKNYGTGGVGSRVAPDWYGHAGDGTPSWKDTGKWIISGEDPFTTYFYAGLAAHYALVLNKLSITDPEEINWQAEAEEAFNWARNNTLPNDENTSERHNYDLSDFEFYAATGLFRLTGDSSYIELVEKKLNSLSANSVLNEDTKWGAYSMVTGNEQNWSNTSLKNKLNGIILATADQKFTSIEQRACRYGGNIWLPMVIGQGTTPRVFEIMMGHYISKEAAPSKTENYMAGIFTTADYFLGSNPMNMTWITHVGVRFPERVMHLDSWYSDTGEIIPGITPYGPWRDQSGGSTIGPWDLRWPYKTLYPEGIENWPGHERWFNNYTTPVNAEFTIHQNTVLSAVVYGYLCDEPDGSYQPNKKPSVQITSPENDSENQGAVTITVEVEDSNGPENIAWVEFYNDWHKIGQSNEPPYSFTWKKPVYGTVKISAKVVDKSGYSAKSETVTVQTSPPTGFGSLQNDKEFLAVFPNPVNDFLVINSSENIEAVEIISSTGIIKTRLINRNFSEKVLNFTGYPEGLYILKLIFSDGTSRMEKIIKKSAY